MRPPAFVVISIIIAALLGLAVLAFGLSMGLSIAHTTRDAANVAGIHPFTGALSNLGISIWVGSAFMWFLAASLHHSYEDHRKKKLSTAFGILSLYLGLDDMLQIHEHIAPGYLFIREESVYLLIGTAAALIFYAFRKELKHPSSLLLLTSLLFLSASVASDQALEPYLYENDWYYLIEDGLKWLGIFTWGAYSGSRCYIDIAMTSHVIRYKVKPISSE